MNGPTIKEQLLRDIAKILRADLIDIQCMDALSNDHLACLREVFREAMASKKKKK
jgi:hypothetical protein